MRLELLRRAVKFKPPLEDLTQIYTTFIRSILEQSSVVWHSGITEGQKQDFERVQKTACKIILNKKYENYEQALNTLYLQKLEDRRKQLCEKFAKSCLKNEKMKHLFPQNEKTHTMQIRNTNKFQVSKANHTRMENSPIIYLQKLLNNLER